jgi:SAM-dependent methyltransferase
MYEKFKRLIKRIFPKKLLFHNEVLIRTVLSLFYSGRDYQCNICYKKLSNFISLDNGEKICPKCGSLSRNRRLWELLNSGFINEGLNVLEFSPSRCLYRKWKEDTRVSYTSADFAGEFISDKKLDITAVEEPDQKYDLIICYHILEHIENDSKAMQELYRILKKGGKCIIQTPFKPGEIYEDWTVVTPEEREKNFGQDDDVRIYSVDGLKERLLYAGFQVDVKQYLENSYNYFGFKEEENVLIAMKT